MGIYIDLKILPNLIEPKMWDNVYEESLILLKNYPNRLMRIKREDLKFAHRLVYSSQLEGKDDGIPYWEIMGDFKTMQTAESFEMSRDILHYKYSKKKKKENTTNILIEMAKEESDELSTVFGAKTQGEDYHTAVLAIAILVENRFPGAALVRGTITKFQAKKATEWANSLLKKKLEIPICLDASRLWKQLSQSFQDEALFTAFTNLFVGNAIESEEIFEKYKKNEAIFKNWMLKKIKNYESVTQLGCLSNLLSWLNVTKDLSSLIDAVCISKKGPQYSPVELAYALTKIWIVIPQEETKHMKILIPPDDFNMNPIHQLGQILFSFHTTGCGRRVYWTCEEVSTIFEKFFPKKVKEINKKLEEETAKVREQLQIAKKNLEHLNKTIKQKEKIESSKKDQKKETDGYLKGLALGIIKMETDLLQQEPEFFSKNSKEFLWQKLICIINERICLTEKTWKRIDQKNKNHLKTLFLLALLDKLMGNHPEIGKIRKLLRRIFEEATLLKKLQQEIEVSKKIYTTKEEIEKAMQDI